MKNIKTIFILTILIGLFITTKADKYFTKTGKISFFSVAVKEKIEAHNRAVGTLLDSKSGQLNYSVLIKSFVFQKKLMQEHFNENYLESSKYPKAKFSGKVNNISKINFNKNGKHNVTVTGTLSIHGKTKKITQKGVLTINGNDVRLQSTVQVALADFDITIPRVVRDKVAKNVKVVIDSNLKKR